MATPITRQQLQGMRDMYKREKLTEIVGAEVREDVLQRAREGCSSYLWVVDRRWLERRLAQQGWANSSFTLEELHLAVQSVFLDCTVSLAEEEVFVPQRESVPTRVLQKGIKIDWS